VIGRLRFRASPSRTTRDRNPYHSWTEGAPGGAEHRNDSEVRPFDPFAIPILGVLPGCGDNSGLARRYPVSGTVLYNGKPLERGNINFVPDGPEGRAAGGTIVDGRYSLTTQTPRRRPLLPGKYKVKVVATASDPSKVTLNLKRRGGKSLTEDQKKLIEAAYPQKIAAKAAATAKSLIPANYNSSETSGLSFEVKERSNTANFELKD